MLSPAELQKRNRRVLFRLPRCCIADENSEDLDAIDDEAEKAASVSIIHNCEQVEFCRVLDSPVPPCSWTDSLSSEFSPPKRVSALLTIHYPRFSKNLIPIVTWPERLRCRSTSDSVWMSIGSVCHCNFKCECSLIELCLSPHAKYITHCR